MSKSKNWYESKTIWGIIVCLIGWVLSEYCKLPVNVNTTDANIAQVVSQIVQLSGMVLAVIGRITATTKIIID